MDYIKAEFVVYIGLLSWKKRVRARLSAPRSSFLSSFSALLLRRMSSTWDLDFVLTTKNESVLATNRTLHHEEFHFTFLSIVTSVILGVMTLTTIIGKIIWALLGVLRK